MYRSKADGGRRHVVFGERLQAEVDHRHAVEQELRTALTSGGLAVVYQPLVDLRDLRVVGHEALVRMVRRVEGATVGPAEFLEVAEESGPGQGHGRLRHVDRAGHRGPRPGRAQRWRST